MVSRPLRALSSSLPPTVLMFWTPRCSVRAVSTVRLSCRTRTLFGRERILKVHARNVPLAPNVDLKVLARGTPGFSGADLMNLVNEAALMAARRNKRVVTMQEFEDAKDKIMMGAERRSSAMTEAEKKLTAYHEAGHAITALNVPVARSSPQGDDHSAWPRTWHGHAVAGRRPLFHELQVDGVSSRHHDGWACC